MRSALIVLVLVHAGCDSSGKTRRGEDALVVLVETEIGDIDPRFASSSYDIKVSRLVFSGLFTADTADLSVEPLLAESISPLDDEGLAWKVTIRDGLAFHDGAPLTSRDVVYTYRSISDPEIGSRYRSTYSYIESVEQDGRLGVVFRLSEENASFLPDLTMPILPAHVLEPHAGRFEDGRVVGSGPFRLVSRDRGRLVLEEHPASGQSPRRLVFLLVRDDNARVLRLRGGGADLAQNNVPVHMLDLFEGRRDVRVVSCPGASFTYVGLNTGSPTLADRRVRQALLVAIDRQAIVEHKLHGRGRVSTGMLPPMHWAYSADVERYPYDPAGARRLLDEAGHPDPPGPDPRMRIVFKTGASRYRLAVARVIASFWEAIGIEVDLRPFELTTLLAHLDSGAFEATMLQIPMVMEPNLYRWFFHSSSIPSGRGSGGANRWRYRSDEADGLIEEGVRVLDVDGRRQVYGRLQAVLARDLPVLPLWHEDNVAVVSTRLGAYRLLPTAPFTSLSP